MKTIKVNDKKQMTIDLYDFITERTNTCLISIDIHKHCKQFVNNLEKIALSEELQDKT